LANFCGVNVVISAVKIARLLVRLPYVIKPGPIPPYAVVKNILAKGEFDAGMSGVESWKPIQISMEDYENIVFELQKIKKGTYTIEAPDGVENYIDWIQWSTVQRAGTRGEELSQLYARRNFLERQRLELVSLGREGEAELILTELIKLDGETSKLLVQVAQAKNALQNESKAPASS
jgi:hypothetical protein